MKNRDPWIQTRFTRAVKRIALAALAVIALGLVGQVMAADEYWRTDGTPGVWANSNWSVGSATATGGVIWTNGNNAVFTANSALSNSTATVGDVTVSAGQTVTITNAGTLTLGGIRTFDIGTGATLNWVSQNQSTTAGNEGAGIIKNSAGILNWGAGAGNNARYDGGFTLNAGTVIMSGKYALTSGAMAINGGTLQSSGGNAYVPSSLAIGGDFTFSGTGNDTWGMATGLGAATRNITNSTVSGSRVFSGVISGGAGAGISFWGSGAGQIYIGNAGNTFSGPINIIGAAGAPEVGFASDGSLGTGNSIVIDGGRLTSSDTSGNAVTSTWSSSRGIQLGDAAGTSISVAKSGGDLAYNGVISDMPGKTGAWAKQGAGILRLGGASTYSGDTSINNGTVQLTTGDNRLPVGTTIYLGQSASANLGALDLNGSSQQIAGLDSVSGINATTAKNTLTNSSASFATLTLAGSDTYAYGDGTTNNSGIIAGAINLVKTGSGIQTLGDTNSYTGNTVVNAGKLALSGKASIAGSASIIIAGGATFDVSGLSSSFVLGSGQTLSNSTSTAVLNGNADASLGTIGLTYASGTPSLTVASGALTLASTTVLNVNNTGAALTTGSYKIVSGTGGSVAGVVPATIAVGGSGAAFASGHHSSLGIISGELYLVVTNQAPVAATAMYSHPSGQPLKIAITNLAANWSDPDGDTVTLSSVTSPSANGVIVTNDASYIYYAYTGTDTTPDSFTYTISDGALTAGGTVNITVADLNPAPQSQNFSTDGGNHPTFNGSGIPDYVFGVERSFDLSHGSWAPVGPVTVGSDGRWSFTDTGVDATVTPSVFYRNYYPSTASPLPGNE